MEPRRQILFLEMELGREMTLYERATMEETNKQKNIVAITALFFMCF